MDFPVFREPSRSSKLPKSVAIHTLKELPAQACPSRGSVSVGSPGERHGERVSNTIQTPASGSVDAREVAAFEAMADSWWDPKGKFRPLHQINPVRVAFIRDHLAAHFGRDPLRPKPLEGLAVLDIGSGGGLLSEPLARLGARVTGIDVGERNVKVARAHAEAMGLDIDYRVATVEAMEAGNQRFDAVLNMEVVEHVTDAAAFLGSSAALVKDDGAMVVATLNRTIKAYLLAIVGAEYVLGWLPRGTHRWQKFLRPSEVAAYLRPHGFALQDLRGIAYDTLRDTWHLTNRPDVNYLAFVTKGFAR